MKQHGRLVSALRAARVNHSLDERACERLNSCLAG
eukprot:CAMPEP_0205932720 /NCGR_PEP_ID=MMETSP1325-20131115/30809_1 /ASSEMBLY_ACC=CAM_ASM_000708 /TAXON_ID=236786 /ORGANISM="Florenciella sp., Strain RCC1007" /LENGTH=34 /DNA_ID= /DNA_START= /DNA_END= /DNA_ORIENTATION=